MFDQLSFEEFTELAKTHKRISVYREIPGDKLTPTNAFLALQKTKKDLTLLESSPKEKHLGRYSHLCFDPLLTFHAYDNNIHIEKPSEKTIVTGNAFDILREYQQEYYTVVSHELSGFMGGLVGYMTYDAIRLIEEIPDNHKDIHGLPQLFFRFYSKNITFDHQTGKIILSVQSTIQNSIERAYEESQNTLNEITQLLYSFNFHEENIGGVSNNPLNISLSDEDFCKKVEKAKDYIKEGDIFQVVLSREFTVKISQSPFDFYRALRYSNPAPFMFYLEANDYVIAGASPEKLISIKNRKIESCPLAGTRARDFNNDDSIAKELLEDPKEVAEHMMLVDLARNDVGKVSKPGTVKVIKLKEIEKYSKVLHISSTVQGELREDKDVFDALKASFPAGTLSGAPKIRAMAIIEELENSKRGIYGGAIVGIDSHGNVDSCIAIRTAFIKDGLATIRAGAGIVHDSIPECEAKETFHKAKGTLLLGDK